jgi:hypothetical protein
MLSQAACSVALAPDDDQCEVDADCAARGGAFAGSVCVERLCQPAESVDPRWSCLGNVTPSEPEVGQTHTYTVPIVEINSQMPPDGLMVSVCPLLDTNCSAPIASGLVPDLMGRVSFVVDSGFDGYLDITATDIVPANVFLGKPVVADTVGEPVLLVTSDDFNNLAAVAGFAIDPLRGHAFLQTLDCNGDRAAGVSVSIDVADASTAGFFRVDMLPDPNATSSDADGSGGFINVPAGFATLEGTLEESDERIGVNRIVVRVGTVAYVPIFPTP